MRRASASIVILAWNEWPLTRACLESLRPTLSPGDEVIVVDNGSRDRTPAGLRSFPWVKVVTNEENRGFAAGCNQGAAVASNDVLVFLNNDTLLTRRWLDALLRPFADPTVGATGPRSNNVSGVQLVPGATYDPARRGTLRAFASEWCEQHRGETTPTHRLVGFCLAVRRAAFDEVGGFDEGYGIGGFEDDDLCAGIAANGHSLLVVHDSFVHHHGHATFEANGLDWAQIQDENEARFRARFGAVETPRAQLLSACLIVKDEEAMLEGCLASLVGVVDEVVVYDTGSTDGTVALARAAGATVTEGYWDDDFARARNDALERCCGEWVLWIDADERLEGDGALLRHRLAGGELSESATVRIVNLNDDGGVELEHRAIRLFRRARGRWSGRLHERIVNRTGQPPLTTVSCDDVHLTHLGYTTALIERKDKQARNLRIAELDAGDDAAGLEPLQRTVNLIRSQLGAGQTEDAITLCLTNRDAAGSWETRSAFLRLGAEVLLAVSRAEEALGWVDDLRRHGARAPMCDFLEGSALLLLGRFERAAQLLDGLDDVWDDVGQGTAPEQVAERRALALLTTGRHAEAVPALLEMVGHRPTAPVWGMLADAMIHAEHPLDELAAAVPDAHLRTVLAQLLARSPEVADVAGAALVARFGADPRLAGFAVHVGPLVRTERALEWSALARRFGLEDRCPLIARAEDAALDPIERLRAAAVATHAFGDERGADAVRRVGGTIDVRELRGALLELDALAPDLLPRFVGGVACSPARANAAADALAALGATDVADELRQLASSPA